MKKLVIFFLAAMMLMISAAGAEETDLFRQLNGKLFEFSSGAGGWSTELTMGENGTFTGVYHDSEMGETGDNYPDGTVYLCSFHGQFTDPVQVDEYTWTVKVRRKRIRNRKRKPLRTASAMCFPHRWAWKRRKP